MPRRTALALICALLILRLPSLVQPMGPDQGLYAYVGERILQGELAYRDAWDQKPPAIHYVYAGLRAAAHRDVVVPAADLIAAAIVAALLWRIGARLGGEGAGFIASSLFLLLSDPGFARYGGVRVRAQCETFIALAITAGLASVVVLPRPGVSAAAGPKTRPASMIRLLCAGLCIGLAFSLKYNAAVYGLVVLLAVAMTTGLRVRDVVVVVIGAVIAPLVLLAPFAAGHAMNDLYEATVLYNLGYSGETYAGAWGPLRYLATFPIQHARVDALWFVGGLGCLALLIVSWKKPAGWIPLAWVAAACVSIALNGSRGLPQYFVQAAPALALAAGFAFALTLPVLPQVVRSAFVLLVAIGVWRVNDFPKLGANLWHDTQFVLGRIDRRTHLARYGGLREIDKYSALDNVDLGAMLAQRSKANEPVFVFGFSPAAYVYADRRSASRFFWSRPVIMGFNAGDASYGVNGLLNDLEQHRPAVVVLQDHDWSPDVQDSGPFFMSQPQLSSWLRANYHEIPTIDGFHAWERNAL
jgi:hypothetical protein